MDGSHHIHIILTIVMSNQLKRKGSVKPNYVNKNRSCVIALNHLDHTTKSMDKMMTVLHHFDDSNMSKHNKQYKRDLINIVNTTSSSINSIKGYLHFR